MTKTALKRKMTEHLSAESREMFEKCVEEFGIEDYAHRKILLTGCEANDRMRMAQAQLKREGLTVRDKNGYLKGHPATHVEKESRAAMFKAFQMLKLEPPSFEEDDYDEN